MPDTVTGAATGAGSVAELTPFAVSPATDRPIVNEGTATEVACGDLHRTGDSDDVDRKARGCARGRNRDGAVTELSVRVSTPTLDRSRAGERTSVSGQRRHLGNARERRRRLGWRGTRGRHEQRYDYDEARDTHVFSRTCRHLSRQPSILRTTLTCESAENSGVAEPGVIHQPASSSGQGSPLTSTGTLESLVV